MTKKFVSIKELSNSLKTKEISAVELTQDYLERSKKLQGEINAFVTITEDIALEQAKKAQEMLDKGEGTLLTGIPMAQKDLFCTEGVLTTCGSKMLSNFIAPYDAAVVEKFKSQGSVMLGKLNMDEFAMGSSTETSFFGATKNPWDKSRVPGGSSGGSAAAVAADMAVFTTCTDTGGSIRQPAALCGITGIKPTYGRVSRWGMIAFASSMDQAGVYTHSVEDAAIALTAMIGHDERDSTSSTRVAEDYLTTLENSIKGKRIGLPKEFFTSSLDAHTAKIIMNAVEVFKKLGAQIVDVSLPNIDLSIPVYYVLAPAEASSNLGRYDGVRYGYRAKDAKNLEELYEKTRGEGFGAEVKRRIITGTHLLTEACFEKYYMPALKVRRLITEEFSQVFQEVDLLLGPSAPTTAFKIGDKEKSSDPLQMYLQDIYTIAVNLAGLPAMSIPAGFENGLPIGMQLIGDFFSESLLLNAAHQYQKETDWHLQHPKEVF